ncbi:MAG: SusC/RagA family TonB-linked outer membrane protein [Mediterranea sp.]|jgi:TonB-linked SusC/RagA family outer membrane protein|nr:SusC/RagA family TonB-linked outer membrane protein [Mediterranea sp.]
MRKCNLLKTIRKVSSKDIPKILFLLFLFSELCFVIPLGAQNRQITGTVLDALSEEPLIGVSVVVKGTPRVTVTDLNGQFAIDVPAGSILELSCIGYIKQEVNVGNQTNIKVNLQENAKLIDEVVVVGFGMQKKVNLTGAVGITTAKELQNRPVMLATQALQGLVPGLSITQNNGSLESRASIRIRGRGTIDSDIKGDPLVLIDGFEGDINSLNPADIDNISVLKDAAASSIYGSKASFGVILITTKKGISGSTKINYSNNFRWNSPLLMPEPMDSYSFSLYVNDALSHTPGQSIRFNKTWLQHIQDYQQGKIQNAASADYRNNTWNEGYSAYTNIEGTTDRIGGIDNRNYYKELFRSSAFSHEHNLSLSGGNDKITFFGSLNYLDQNGLMVFGQDTYDRYSINAKINYVVNEWVNVSYSDRFVRNNYERPSAMTNNLFQDIGRQGWPTLPMYDPNGNLFFRHAVKLRDGGRDMATTDNAYQQLQLVLEPVKNWKTHVDASYATMNYNQHWHSLIGYIYDRDNNPQAGASNMSTSSNVHEENTKENLFGLNVYSEYNFTLSNRHNFKGMVGIQEQEMNQQKIGLQR